MFKKTLPPLIPGEDIILRRGEIISVVSAGGDQYYTSNLYSKFIDGVEFIGVFNKPYPAHRRRIMWLRKDSISRQ